MDSTERQQHYAVAEKLLSEQNFVAAAITGLCVLLLSAAVYGMLKSVSESAYYSIAAGGGGVAIGISMQLAGRGIDVKFALLAAVYALLACMLGNMFAVVMDLARSSAASPVAILRDNGATTLFGWMFARLILADWMFWAIGIGSAAYLARRALGREEGFALHAYRLKL